MSAIIENMQLENSLFQKTQLQLNIEGKRLHNVMRFGFW